MCLGEIMTDKKEHPHAWVLRALADGEPLENFEFKLQNDDCWLNLASMEPLDYPQWLFRRKPRTIRIGDLDVPEPMREAPAFGAQYWIASVNKKEVVDLVWQNDTVDKQWLAAGLCHTTKEAAELHRKALILWCLGVRRERT